MIYDKVLKNPTAFDFNVSQLGDRPFKTPLQKRNFVKSDQRVAFSSQVKNIEEQLAGSTELLSFEKAGPREKLFFNPRKTRAAIVSCGGLCPGINNVIHSLVGVLLKEYGVNEVLGFRYGYRGMSRSSKIEPAELNLEVIDGIQNQGGTILGSSRGGQDTSEMVDLLVEKNIDVLFCLGGDGTQKGAQAIAQEVATKGLEISIIGIPKTIDNDIEFVEKTFGFETAVQIASGVISCAHSEARGAENGIGIVKLMGRDSGFIAASATLANSSVDFCLVPEVNFELNGKSGLINKLERTLNEKKHALIVVSEGAGQHLFTNKLIAKDKSNNLLKEDIGVFLKKKITESFTGSSITPDIKYFDPSYQIRSTPAIASDAIFCYHLAEHAVHAAMAGKTNILIGHWNNFFTHVPIHLATKHRRLIDLDEVLWQGVLSSTQSNF
jgi:6-phosphofructokinase 1